MVKGTLHERENWYLCHTFDRRQGVLAFITFKDGLCRNQMHLKGLTKTAFTILTPSKGFGQSQFFANTSTRG